MSLISGHQDVQRMSLFIKNNARTNYQRKWNDKTIFTAAQADFDEEDFPYSSNSVDRTLQSTNGILSIPFTGINRPRSDNDDNVHQNHDQGGGNDDDDDHPDFPQPKHPNGGNDPVDHHQNQNDGEDQSRPKNTALSQNPIDPEIHNINRRMRRRVQMFDPSQHQQSRPKRQTRVPERYGDAMGRMPIRDRLRLRTYNNLPDSNDQGESPDQEFIQGSSRDHEQEIPPAEHQIQQSTEDEMEQDHNDIEIDRTPPQTDDEVVNYVQILSQEGGTF
uniref:Uncharacterized protein n=1 Tax=Moniliophthora roreri TaxID=221103 RepID=A0A0W0GC12_MONRR